MPQNIAHATNDSFVSNIALWSVTALNDDLFRGSGPLEIWTKPMESMTPALAQIFIADQLKAAKILPVTDGDINTITTALKT